MSNNASTSGAWPICWMAMYSQYVPDRERAGVEPEAEHRGAARRRALPQPHEHRRHEDGQRPPAERRERQRQQHARDERGHAADVAAFDDFAQVHSFL